MACFRHRGFSFLLIRLPQVASTEGNNDLDCPRLCMTNLFYCIDSHLISHAVSVIHECTSTCNFVSTTVTSTVEHEQVASTALTYMHDYSNKNYCLNVYICAVFFQTLHKTNSKKTTTKTVVLLVHA